MLRKKIKNFDNISLKPENVFEQLDFNDIFGRDAAVHIEIGSGKGTFLVAQAAAFGEVNFLGIEWSNKYYRFAVDRIGRWGLGNVRIIRTDAADFIAEHVPNASVECFHIYFPDPWPKKRHNKRRFICPKNMKEMLRCLKDGGVINAATDHADYFEQMKEVFLASNEHLDEIEFTCAAGAQEGEVAGTNYERKYIKDGRRINTIAGRKKTGTNI